MSNLKLGQRGKEIFLEVYNDVNVKSVKIAKEVTERLQKEKILDAESKLTNELVRDIYEQKLNLLYKNRKRKEKVKKERIKLTADAVEFDDDDVLDEALEIEEELVMTGVSDDEKPVTNYEPHRNEPVKFDF